MSNDNEAVCHSSCTRVEDCTKTQHHTHERITALEDRVAHLEPAVARVPQVEARIQRMERLVMDIQGDIRRLERASVDYQRRVEEKLDNIINLILGGTKLTVVPAQEPAK